MPSILLLPRRGLFTVREAVVCTPEAFEPDAAWPTGILAFAQPVRGVVLPEGTRLFLDTDVEEVAALLPVEWDVLGHRLPKDTELAFASKRFSFPLNLVWWPLKPFVLVVALVVHLLRPRDRIVVRARFAEDALVANRQVPKGSSIGIRDDGRVASERPEHPRRGRS